MNENTPKLATAASYIQTYGGITNWSPEDVDKLEIVNLDKYTEVVNDCRFFYQRDPIASTVLNKMVEISINSLDIEQGTLNNNEYKIFMAIRDELLEFLEQCALEYLVSGLVIPEIKYGSIGKNDLRMYGIKKYNSLVLPISMWLRDPTTIEIKDTSAIRPSFFVVLPEKLIFFIKNEGKYPDGTEDKELWKELREDYPEFISLVKSGETKILLQNHIIIRRKIRTGTPYPLPYLYPALEALKHKRNLRRMDYSLASRVISAIQLFKLGNDNFPVTEDDDSQFEEIRDQMTWRNSGNRDMERVFQLFANHTLEITWVMPDISALIDDSKYYNVNQDIFLGVGFPKILTTGETERTQTSNAEFAMISPTKTMENIQRQLINIAKNIMFEIYKRNNLKDFPKIKFNKINLNALEMFARAMSSLYDTGNLSRTSYLNEFGYNFEEEMNRRMKEQELMEDLGLSDFAPMPYSPQPEKDIKEKSPENDESIEEDTEENTENQENSE